MHEWNFFGGLTWRFRYWLGDWLGDWPGDWPGDLAKWLQKRAHGPWISVRASGAGIDEVLLNVLTEMSVDILGTSWEWDQCRSMVQYSFTSTETRRLRRTDIPAGTATSTLTQLLNYDAGIENGGSSMPWKIRHRWPRIWNKEEFVTEMGRQLFHAHTGKETPAPHDRTKTQYQRTSDRPT